MTAKIIPFPTQYTPAEDREEQFEDLLEYLNGIEFVLLLPLKTIINRYEENDE